MTHMDPDLDQNIAFALDTCPFFCDIRKDRNRQKAPYYTGLYGPIMEP